MNEQAQRIAIAKWMGWCVVRSPFFKYLCRPSEEPSEGHGVCCGLHLDDNQIFRGFFVLGECGPDYVVPDYTRDLNAMAQAEAKLDVNRLALYADALDKLCVPQHICALTHWQAVAMASAAQRAEALLRCLGLWTDAEAAP